MGAESFNTPPAKQDYEHALTPNPDGDGFDLNQEVIDKQEELAALKLMAAHRSLPKVLRLQAVKMAQEKHGIELILDDSEEKPTLH